MITSGTNRLSFVLTISILMVVTGCGTSSVAPTPAGTAAAAATNLSTGMVSATNTPVITPGKTPDPTPALKLTSPAKAVSRTLPDVEHLVVVMEENHSYKQIVGSKNAPYLNQLIEAGALFTNSHGVAHPSQPNYLALFSGSTQNMKDDRCGETYDAANLASELLEKGLTFMGYSEDLPKPGFTGCSSKGYARKHNPWVQFTNVPADVNQPLNALPKDYSNLPTVAFVVPNHQDDMHDGTVQEADEWLKTHLDSYVKWAASHNSLLIVTWDEDDNTKENRIPTLLIGPMIKPGRYGEEVDHYRLLRTIGDLFELKPLGQAAEKETITSVWKPGDR